MTQPNHIYQRRRRKRLYAEGLNGDGKEYKRGKPVAAKPAQSTTQTALEARWERERAGMKLKPASNLNWHDRADTEAHKAFKPLKGGSKTKWTR